MKKLVLGVTVAALVGVSSSCFAIGLPKMPKAPGAAKPAAASNEAGAQAVDLGDITNKQGKILKYMCGALYAQARSYQVIDEAKGVSDPDLAAAVEALKAGTKAGATKAKSVLAKKQESFKKSVAQKEAIEKNAEQVANLAKAIKLGRVYQKAALVNYGFVASNVPGALSEATGALKNVGKNPQAISKINGAISTYKLGGEIAGQSQAVSNEYNKIVDVMKSDYGVSDEALANAQAPDVAAVAEECLAFVQG